MQLRLWQLLEDSVDICMAVDVLRQREEQCSYYTPSFLEGEPLGLSGKLEQMVIMQELNKRASWEVQGAFIRRRTPYRCSHGLFEDFRRG